jgi:dTDP-4-dehydrorhamnose reductase
MNKILIIGAKGMLGYAVSEYFDRKGYPVVKISRSDYDIAKEPFSKFEKLAEESDVIINCAGVIKPMIAHTPIEDVLRVNSIFPKNLAKLAGKTDKKCIHITTDCVFSGSKGNYTEDDYFDADDVYGLSKNAGDDADCMVLRTSIIGEEKGQGRSLLEWARSMAGKEVNGFLNHIWNGVTTVYFAEIIEKILNGNMYKKGLFHIHSPNALNKFELLSMINKVYDLRFSQINQTQANVAVDRSLGTKYSLSEKVVSLKIQAQLYGMKKFFTIKD